MTAQDRYMLIVALASGISIATVLVGLGWATAGLYSLTTRKASPC